MIVPGLLGMTLGFAGAFLVHAHGRRWGLLDVPNPRSSHRAETPKGGGIGILFAFCLATGWSGFSPWIWLPVVGLSLASLSGDRKELSAKFRLILQFASAGIACWQVGRHFGSGIFWSAAGPVLGLLGASLFIVATANVYNFMDGIDGIAGITGVFAFGLLALTGWLRGEPAGWVVLAAVMAAACAGFLPWNFPRARIFMGDVGSILLGFVFALFVAAWSRSLADLIMFCLFLSPFYADELVTLFPRLRSKDSLFCPHRRHVYQILTNQMDVPHWKVSSLYGVTQIGVAGGAFLIRPWGWIAEMCWLGFVLGVSWRFASYVRQHET